MDLLDFGTLGPWEFRACGTIYSPFGMALFNGASIAQMGAGLDHERRLDLEIGPITIFFILEYETLETNVENELII